MPRSLFRRHFKLHALLLRTHRPTQDRQTVNISLGTSSRLQRQHPWIDLPPCSACCVRAPRNERACQCLLEPHHPHLARWLQCPPASSLLAKNCSPAVKTGLLTKVLQWSSLARDSTASGSNATEGARTRTAAASPPNNESASGVRVVCWDVGSRCWRT